MFKKYYGEISVKKVYYIGFMGDPDTRKKRKSMPATETKMQYVIESMTKVGFEVEVLSFSYVTDRSCFFKKYSCYERKFNDVRVHYFTSYASKFRAIRVLGRCLEWLQIKNYLIKNVCPTDSFVLVYHSLSLFKVIKLFLKKKKSFVYEVEEIYSDAIGANTKFRQKEINVLRQAKAYIFSTSYLGREINTDNKPQLIAYGTYKKEPDRNVRLFEYDNNAKMRKIHCVYAGTLDPRKGGSLAAAAAAEFLPNNYHIHILGFGSEKRIQEFKKILETIGEKTAATLTYDGILRGEDYIRFIQSCDIGLSTQNPDAAFNATSFPSKILSYMANGLRVVSIRIPVVEQSEVGDLIYYYDKQTPQEIANAILNVNINSEYDSRKRIEKLDKSFRSNLQKIFL